MSLIPEISRYIYHFILLILATYSILTIHKNTYYVKIYCVLICITEGLGFIYLEYYKTPFKVLYNIMAIVEMAFFVYFYFKLCEINKKYNLPFISIYIMLFLILGDFNFLKLNMDAYLVNNISITCFIGYYLFFIIKNSLDLNGYFWISVGGLFYYFGSFVLLGIITLLAKINPQISNQLFSLNYILNSIFYGFVLYGLVKLDRDTVNSLSNKID